MSEAKFTKGKWRVEHFVNEKGFEIAYNDDGEVIADYVYEESDAHLIAAAPEMYNLINDLRHAISMGGLGGGINNAEVLKSIDELLAKARGEL